MYTYEKIQPTNGAKKDILLKYEWYSYERI